jgi:hypothetical protein
VSYLIAAYAFATVVLGGYLALSLIQLHRLTQKKR